MPPKRSLKRQVQRHRAKLLAVQELVRKRAPDSASQPEEDPAAGGWRDSLETAAQCLMGTVVVGLSAYALRGLSNHVSRDAVFLATSSAFCLCGVASNAAAFADKTEVGAPQVHPTATRTTGEVDWFSTLITELWPHIQNAAVAMKDEVMEPMIKQSVPSISFQEFDLGEVTPKVSIRDVRSRGASRGITLKMDVAWTSDSKISMTAHAIPFGVRSIAFAGTLHVDMQPIILEPPIVGAVQVYFIDRPDIVLHYTGVAALARMPGLERAIQQAIDDCIASMVVLPNRMSFPMAYGLDMADVDSPPPVGILWVRPVCAENICAADTHLLSANTSDPYVVFELGKQKYRTKTIWKTLNPVWEEEDGMWYARLACTCTRLCNQHPLSCELKLTARGCLPVRARVCG